MVTMDDLYYEMKEALRYFDLRFGQMNEVEVSCLDDGRVEFSYDGRKIVVQLLAKG